MKICNDTTIIAIIVARNIGKNSNLAIDKLKKYEINRWNEKLSFVTVRNRYQTDFLSTA